ncbi:hypothetical protein AMC99_02310 [Altererythrobacter epoxidivorans]|uniref:Uncharacterized protein n=1 Tax=Altererythrobacter epoxidivorans TaxID=361183 RepID=A0A0M4M9N4_9SPHN|nr:hypothetical protein [Altererythrobacter epoxidivorans]ALE17585.1 hypothetical protein AMC99_02310 [Altererythrobacter epoxidivorans]
MIQLAAQGAILIAAGWLVFAALVMTASPETARRSLAAMGSTPAIQFGEHIPRAIVGIALILRAAQSKAPLLFEIGGWFILASSILILLAPRKWHNAYAVWWAERIPAIAFRLLSLPTIGAAAWLAWACL